MRDRRHAGIRTARPSAERWLLSYADFITLLFAFFTALYASSTIDATRLAIVADGLQRALAPGDARTPSSRGVLPGDRSLVPGRSHDPRPDIMRELHDEIASGQVELSEDGRGLVLSLPQASAFPVGGSDLSPAAAQAMTRLAMVLDRIPNFVRVEGHTDDVPIHTAQFASNWELSTSRAVKVVQYLIEQGHVSPERLSAAGYSAYHPRVPNSSDASRAQNRRVDIVIVGDASGAAAAIAGKGSAQ